MSTAGQPPSWPGSGGGGGESSGRVLLFGRDGQVGHALLPLLAGRGWTVVALGRTECDLCDLRAVRAAIAQAEPAAIVNAAAYTAVDKAESDRERCFAVNAAAPAAMAREAGARGIPLIHYSTDYVFDGEKPDGYVEADRTGPLNVYGESKLRGEEEIAASGTRFAVLRTSWVYSNHGNNFFRTMLRLGLERPELRVVADQRGAPTSAGAIAAATLEVLEQRQALQPGVYHMTASGATTWFGFAEAIFRGWRGGDKGPRLTPISTDEYPTPARRPRHSLLRNDKFADAFGFRLPSWEEQLSLVLAERAELMRV